MGDSHKAQEGCKKAGTDAETASGVRTEAAARGLRGAGEADLGGGLAKTAGDVSRIYGMAKNQCREHKKKCNSCDTKGKSVTPPEKTQMDREKQKCDRETQALLDKFRQAEQANADAARRANQTKDAAKSNPGGQQGGQQQQPQQQPQQQQQQPQQAQQQPPTQPNQSPTPTPTPTDPIKPDEKKETAGELNCSGTSPLTPEQKKQCDAQKAQLLPGGQCPPGMGTNECRNLKKQEFCSPGGNAGGPTSACPSCKGIAGGALAGLPIADLTPMCNGACSADPEAGPNLADACRRVVAGQGTTPESIPGGSSGFAPASSGGGGGSTAGGGGSNAAQLVDANALRALADQQGNREGQGMGSVDSSGGFGSYGGGANGGGGDDSSPKGPGGIKTQSSTGGGGVPAGVTDVEKQYGLSVISIVSNVIRQRCNQGRFLHCGPGR